jgi:hypothetical protein
VDRDPNDGPTDIESARTDLMNTLWCNARFGSVTTIVFCFLSEV